MTDVRFYPLDTDPEILVATVTGGHRSAAAIVTRYQSSPTGEQLWKYAIAGDVQAESIRGAYGTEKAAITEAAGQLCGLLGVMPTFVVVCRPHGAATITGPEPEPDPDVTFAPVRGWTTQMGGGHVQILVDRDTENYPPDGLRAVVVMETEYDRLVACDDGDLPHWPGDGPDEWRDEVTELDGAGTVVGVHDVGARFGAGVARGVAGTAPAVRHAAEQVVASARPDPTRVVREGRDVPPITEAEARLALIRALTDTARVPRRRLRDVWKAWRL